MKNLKTATTIIITLILILAIFQTVKAQTNETHTFFTKDYGGISIKIDATNETVPGGNMTISLWINSTAEGVNINYLNLSVYGFIHGLERTLINSTNMMENTPLEFNKTLEQGYTIQVPDNVWEATYGEILLKYTIKDLTSPEYNPGVPLTTIRNTYLENIENQLEELNQTYVQLLQNYTDLNQTYWQLQGNLNDLGNTRAVAVMLTITTIFFVATTLYMIFRRPKEYW